MTPADLETQLKALRDARSTGVRKVEYQSSGESRSVEYRSDSELAAAIADLERQIAAARGRSTRVVYVNYSKGT